MIIGGTGVCCTARITNKIHKMITNTIRYKYIKKNKKKLTNIMISENVPIFENINESAPESDTASYNFADSSASFQ